MMPWAWLGVVCLVAAAPQEPPPKRPPTAAPVAATPAPDPELERFLKEWDVHAAKLHDLQVPFTQERKLAIRKRVTKATGTLAMRRDARSGKRAIRWRFATPRKRVEVMTATEVRTWEAWLPRERQVVEVRDLRAFGLDPEKLDVLGRSATHLRKHYTITRRPPPKERVDPPGWFRIRLEPRDAAIAKRVAHIDLVLDRKLGLPREVVIAGPRRTTKRGKVRQSMTTYRFDLAKAKRNTGLKAEAFVLAPAGVPIKKR